jgi:NTE family protein
LEIVTMKGNKKFALVLSGGGVKGAWEAGFLKYVAENWGHKFTTVCGSSAGALNGFSYVSAAASENLPEKIIEPWNKVTFGQVAKVPWSDIFTLKFYSLMDNSPLMEFLQNNLDVESYRRNIDTGVVETNIITTTELSEKKAYIWVDSKEDRNYNSANWKVVKSHLGPEHATASGAIPVAFRSVQLEEGWHIDGGLCNNTPILPAIMSMYRDREVKTAEDPEVKILVLTLPEPETKQDWTREPTILTQTSRMFESLTVNHISQDVSKANTINEFLDSMGLDYYGKYRRINLMLARPSKSLDSLAATVQEDIAWGLIPSNWMTSLAFILIFQPYIQVLLKEGYEDAKGMHDQLEEFFNS